MSKNKKSSQFSRVYRTDETTLIPIIQGSPLFNAIITPEDFANGLYPFLGIDNKVDKLSGHSLVPDEEIVKLKALDSSGELDLSSVELLDNKQNSLEPDETELKYPTVKAVIEGLETKVNIEEGKSLVDDLEIERLSTVTNQDISNLVEKIEGYSLVKDTEIAKLEALTDTGEIDLSHLELAENKQNSLLEDTSGVKFPTVDAVNEGLNTKVDKEYGKSLVDDAEILRLSSVVNQDISNLVEKEEGKSLIADTEIARLATLENVSIEHLATKEELESKVDKEEGKSLVSDEEILRLSTVTNQNIENLATKDELSGKVDKEEGKSLVDDEEIARLALVSNQDTSHLATKDELSGKVDKEEGKVLIEQTELTRLAGVTNQDISNLATKNELSYKVDKEVGKSLIADEEIVRLSTVTNQDISNLATKNELNNKADKGDLNAKQDTLISGLNIKTINNISLLGTGNITIEGGSIFKELDPIYQSEKHTLALKSELFNKDYNELINKPNLDIYLTEHQDISNLASKDEIPNINGLASESFVIAKIEDIDIPTNTSELVNDSGFITNHQDISHLASKVYVDNEIANIDIPEVDLTDYATKSEINAKADKSYVDNRVKTDVPEGAVFTDTIVDISNLVVKEEGKSLIDDTEIVRLSTVENQVIPTTLPADGGNADTIGGYSIVITTEALKGSDANTLYFCIE